MLEQESRDYYAILGVSSKASSEEIKKKYKELAKKYHPDLNPDPAAEKIFQDISAAYHVLSDDARRGKYDQEKINPFNSSGYGRKQSSSSDPFEIFKTFGQEKTFFDSGHSSSPFNWFDIFTGGSGESKTFSKHTDSKKKTKKSVRK